MEELQNKKNPWIAVGLSLLMTGLGHAYLKKYWEFVGLLILQIIFYLYGYAYIIYILAVIYSYTETIKYNKNLERKEK